MESAVLNKSSKLWEQKEKFVANAPFHYAKIFVEKALGACLWDVDGKKYIDFAGGIGTLNVGHCHPKVVEAVQMQAEKFIHTCFHVAPYESYIQVCEKLVQITPGNFPKKAVLFNSGAEAVENAVKIARRYTGRQAVSLLIFLSMEEHFWPCRSQAKKSLIKPASALSRPRFIMLLTLILIEHPKA